ncbi:hypothetical protein [Lentzea jiangxiensis]
MADRVGAPLPIGIHASDGSVAGPQDGAVLVIRSRDALRRLVWSPNELGPARAYLSGELDLEGEEARLRGALHTKSRDRHAISHHYWEVCDEPFVATSTIEMGSTSASATTPSAPRRCTGC